MGNRYREQRWLVLIQRQNCIDLNGKRYTRLNVTVNRYRGAAGGEKGRQI